MAARSNLQKITGRTIAWLTESEPIRLFVAQGVWFLWFGWLWVSTLIARVFCEPISDSDFLQGTGVTSAAALLLTLLPNVRTQRLHCLMLALSCLVFYGLQRPTAFTPHGQFLRAFKQVEPGMTTEQVRTALLPYQTSDSHYKRQRVFVNSQAARKYWFHPGYSGRLHFAPPQASRPNGKFDIIFRAGRVESIYCLNR